MFSRHSIGANWYRANSADSLPRARAPSPAFFLRKQERARPPAPQVRRIARFQFDRVEADLECAVSCREADGTNSVQFKRCDLSVMRGQLARERTAVSRRENETRKVQLGLLWLSCTSIGNGN